MLRQVNIGITVFSIIAMLIISGCAVSDETFSAAVKIQPASEIDSRLEWFTDARFGMFIHWGPVSIKGTEIGWSRGEQVPLKEYDNLYKQFNPTKFNAAEWVGLAKDAGMKYLVITAKHHDGFCLWDSKYTDYDIMSTPFQRDVVKELSEECKKQGIKFCLYYSILDWYQPDYNPVDHRGGPGYKLGEGTEPSMERYIVYMKNQLQELIENYGPIGILWFDGHWEKQYTHEMGKDLYAYVRSLQPDIIINNRVDKGQKPMEGSTAKGDYAGDYDTPEQRVGKFQLDRPWETCMTICQQWAWKPGDKMKSFKQCIQTLVKTVGRDGNLLFNVGPMPDGRIEPRQADRLREMGDWLEKYGESIYGTKGGPLKPGIWGVSTNKNDVTYLHIMNWKDDSVTLPLLQGITLKQVLTGGKITISPNRDGLTIRRDEQAREPVDTIIALKITDKL